MTPVVDGLVLLDTDIWSRLFSDARRQQLTVDLRTSGHALQQKQHTGERRVAATAIAIGAPLFSADGIYRGAPSLTLLD